MTNWDSLPKNLEKQISGDISILSKLKPNKPSKMHNNKSFAYGRKWHSNKELARYDELLLMEKAGEIKDLEIQPYFCTLDTLRTELCTHSKKRYTADFKYFDNKEGKIIVEDVKSEFSRKDPYYRLRIHLFQLRYPDVCFREVV